MVAGGAAPWFVPAHVLGAAGQTAPSSKITLGVIGESAWVHVRRGRIEAFDDHLLRGPQNKCATMPVQLPISSNHTRNFVDAIKNHTQTICDIETAVRSDTLCQLSLIAVKQGGRLLRDPLAERFTNNDGANAMLQTRAFRGEWRLPEV